MQGIVLSEDTPNIIDKVTCSNCGGTIGFSVLIGLQLSKPHAGWRLNDGHAEIVARRSFVRSETGAVYNS